LKRAKVREGTSKIVQCEDITEYMRYAVRTHQRILKMTWQPQPFFSLFFPLRRQCSKLN